MNAPVKPETAEQRDALDRVPFDVMLEARKAQIVIVRPRYPRAYVLGIHFDAPVLEGLYVKGLQMEHYEQLALSPLPARVFNDSHSLVLPVAHASIGLELSLLSLVSQRVTLRVHFTECRNGEPRSR